MNEERALWMINKKNNIMKITNKNTKLKVRHIKHSNPKSYFRIQKTFATLPTHKVLQLSKNLPNFFVKYLYNHVYSTSIHE